MTHLFSVVSRDLIKMMQPAGQSSSKLSSTTGYIFSHGDFSLSNMSSSSPEKSKYSILLSPTINKSRYKWLYLDLIYFDIASSTDCEADTDSGLRIVNSDSPQTEILYKICMRNNSVNERVIWLDRSVRDLRLEYEYQQQMMGEKWRGFVLYYKSKILLFSV